MKIAMLGSLGNINRLVLPRLVAAGHAVTVVTTNSQRRAAIEARGARAAVGTMQDEAFLAHTFSGQDVVYLMLSGGVGDDPFASAVTQAQIWKRALLTAGVKNVVDLSSVGADAGPVAGSLHAYNLIEGILKTIPDVNLACVRPTGFYANLFANVASIQTDHAIYANNAPDLAQKYVAPIDIANVVYPLITATPAGTSVHYAFSDTFTGNDFVAALRTALNLPDLKWVQLSDDQYLANLTSHGVPTKIAAALLQTSHYQRQPEQVYADLTARHTPAGQVKLADFVQTYVEAYNGQGQHRSHTIAD
ncbi:short-chain dehydrogenase [Lactiplantibacillus garii]|uniref:Short-chain dehydrogenase n=1 Tax=Lactiplantibacillus garii TaxID=2306423 RepID=A0A3R8J6N6_9LACO|nr:NAD(P)H-binding protein [Lactiplantibacillus garii]RRK10211.1 short-chain dehydrogenase [Lactiplantibacillus garii]